MIGYRFKTEEEMVASFGPDWKNNYAWGWGLDDRILGLPINTAFHTFIVDKARKITKTDSNIGFVAVHTSDIATYKSRMFDIKDLDLNKELSLNIISYPWNTSSATKEFGHPIPLDWIVPFYIDVESWAKRSIDVNKRIKVKLPTYDAT